MPASYDTMMAQVRVFAQMHARRLHAAGVQYAGQRVAMLAPAPHGRLDPMPTIEAFDMEDVRARFDNDSRLMHVTMDQLQTYDEATELVVGLYYSDRVPFTIVVRIR